MNSLIKKHNMDNKNKVSRWYFGGTASAMAACITHPLDLIKVLLQTQQEKTSIIKITLKVLKTDGILGLYNGISASLTRQLTYSMTRFAIYDIAKNYYSSYLGYDPNFAGKIGCASIAGAAGGFVGTPADMVNVRMQNDVKLPSDKRRNYKHIFDGLWRVYRTEGVSKLFSGGSIATTRAVVITVGQLSCYDHIKTLLLNAGFGDNSQTHFLASLSAGAIATTLTQPLDVLKTRSMNAKPGEFASIFALIAHTAKAGPLAFFKGYIPAFVRLGPHTILTFLFLEQLRMNFGYFPSTTKS